jgi:hypothetical protein
VDPDLLDTGPHPGHWLPVRRLKALLNPAELETSQTSRVLRKGPEVVQGGPHPQNGLIHTAGIIQSPIYGRKTEAR